MTGFPLQPTKVQRPPLRPETLSRERLLDWLGIKIHNRLILVTAEAGYGKTTLLADFSRRTRLKTLWFRVDEEDAGWISVLNYLVAAGREVDPGFAPATGEMLAEIGTSATSKETVVDTFLREYQALGRIGGAALIVDDYHLIDGQPDVRALMREVVLQAPERLSIVFLSRRRPALPIARLRALGEIAELSTDDLRFTADETDRLFRETYGRPLDTDVLSDLARRTEGWAASLQLVHTALRDRTAAEIRSFVRRLSGVDADLYDYLAEEVVGELNDDLQRFLMHTAILQTVEPDLITVVAGFDEVASKRLIEQSEWLGLLSRRGETTYHSARYHPLVRDFLEERLRRAIGLPAVLDLHRAVARYAEGRNWRLAGHHYAAAGDLSDLHRVIESSIRSIMGAGDFALAQSYIERFPPAGYNAVFEIVGSRVDYYENRHVRALERAERSYRHLTDRCDAERDTSLLNLISIQFQVDEVDRAISNAEHLAETAEDPGIRAIARATALTAHASVDLDLREYIAYLESMEGPQRTAGQSHYLGVTNLNLAVTLRLQGDATRALQRAEAARAAFERDEPTPEAASAEAVRAWALAHMGRTPEALAAMAWALGTQHAITRTELLVELADIHLWYGASGDAAAAVQEAIETGAPALRRDYAALAAAELAVREGRYSDAESELSRIDPNTYAPLVGMKVRYLCVRALIAVRRRDPDAAERVQEALRHAERQSATFWVDVCRVLQASLGPAEELRRRVRLVATRDSAMLNPVADVVSARIGDLDDQSLGLVAAEAQARPDRWRPALRRALRESEPASRLSAARLLDLVGTRDDVPALRTFARRLKSTPDQSLGRGLARRLASRVFVEDQGRVVIRVGSIEIPGSDVRRKVLALLCYLLTRPHMSATKDQVLEALWPEMEPDVATNSLNQTVYFLRRVIEPGYKEDVSAEYVHHDSDVLWLDPELVDSRSVHCAAILRSTGRDPSPDEAASISDAYQGPFALDFAYEDWAAAYRDSMHTRYLDVIERAIQLDTASGHFDRGITLARRALDLDPDADHLELSLLRLYRRVGAHAAAAEQYAHYSTVMREHLGMEPPPLDSL